MPDVLLRPAPCRWHLLVPLGLAMALSLTGDSTLYAVLPDQTGSAGITLAVLGVLLAANRIIRIPGNLVAGALYDRCGRRGLFLAGLALGVLSTLGYSLVRGFWALLGARTLWGIAWSLINVGGYTMVLDRSSPGDRGRMLGLYQLSFALGLAVSPIIGGTLTDAVGYRPALRFCAALSGLGAAVAVAALPETKPPSERKALAGGLAWRERLKRLVPASIWQDGAICRLRCVYFTVFFVNSGVMMSTLSLYVRQRWGDGVVLAGQVVGVATAAGGLLALRSLAAMAAGPLAGLLSDRQPKAAAGGRPLDRWLAVRLGLLLSAAGFLVLGTGGTAWTTGLGVVLVSGGAASSIVGVAALSGDVAAKGRAGAAMGTMAAAGDLGSAAGPLVAYALTAKVELGSLYLLCAGVLLSSLLLSAVASAGPAKSSRARQSGQDTRSWL